MEKLYEAIERVPEQFRYVVIFAVALLVGMLYWFLMRMPAQDELARQVAAYEEIHKDLLEKKRIADNLQFWQLEVQRLRGQLEEALARLPTAIEMDELLINIPNIAKKNALEVSEFALDQERAKKGYAEVPMLLKMSGTYQGLGGFAQEVGDQARIMAVRSAKLKAQKSRGKAADSGEPARDALGASVDPGTDLDIEAEVVTYRFLETPAPAAAATKRRP
jgi:type IV pilus assembly protein PilO